ncbi:polyamine ABC transporter substrate-binding protein [Cereibacter changlensis JA139]|uniref:Polyamine ABC transporter substrate-binding protein n=2 Tax=Cereibacter changlensis TaxID=402884 RepID=A0A2T4JRS2_9RHOB|nr:extracellular solute-binding protein [Cereibacter changlensis]PTE20611.1 polyamine ABC transporter substrate-binding protein [Cereibacter changlensis JA139]PZX48817.1 spermidine/putrescine transport system substrate-binding protein [Cereibacter changlensis]
MIRRTSLLASAALAFALPAFAADSDLIVFDWAGFEDDNLLADYIAKHGDKPTYAFYGDDDEAFQKVSSGFKADVAHPCSQMVSKYRDAGLIEPWDVSRIPEYANIAPRFTNSEIFKDDTGVWYIPTDYAYTAIAYNTEAVPAEEVSTLQVFLDPKYQGRISLPDNTDDIWSLALLATGVTDWTNVTDEQFTAAADWLRQAHANVRAYWADPSELAQLMATGEVQVAWSWNDSIALMRGEGFPVGFERQAKEGAATWFCGYVNFKDAPGSEDKAYDFINSWLAHPSAKGLLEGFGYAHTNDAAMAEISEEELVAADVNPIDTTLLAQTPIAPEMRDRMLQEFEMIKSGF